jgi:hypothetical protein
VNQAQPLKAGDMLLLGEKVRLTVLAVEEGTVLLEITEGANSRVVAVAVPPEPLPRQGGQVDSPSEN